MRLWIRLAIGILLVLVGLVWIGQGLDLIKGSMMTGHRRYAVAGAVVALGGLWLLWGPLQARLQPRRI